MDRPVPGASRQTRSDADGHTRRRVGAVRSGKVIASDGHRGLDQAGAGHLVRAHSARSRTGRWTGNRSTPSSTRSTPGEWRRPCSSSRSTAARSPSSRWVRTRATDALRKALAMGADKAVHITDDGLAGSCALQTSAALAAAIRPLGGRPGDHRQRVHRRPHRVDPVDAGRAARSAADHLRPDPGDRRHHAAGRAGAGRRLQRGHRDPAGRHLGHREDQRAAVPELQGHHGREEEAGQRPSASPTSGSTAGSTGLANASTVVVDGAPRPPRTSPARRSPTTAPAAPRSPSTWPPPG